MNLAIRVNPFSTSISIAGQVVDFAPGEVAALLDQFVPVGTPVAAWLQHAAFSGEVLCCLPKDGGYQTNIRFKDSDENGLRRTPRFSVKLSAQVFSRSASCPQLATIVDISGFGLGLLVPCVLSVGDPIAVESEMNIALGIVRYSRSFSKDTFRIGVELHHVLQKHDERRSKNSPFKVLWNTFVHRLSRGRGRST